MALWLSLAAVRDALGTYWAFRRTPDSEEADQLVDSGAIATYSPAGELMLVEVNELATAVPTVRSWSARASASSRPTRVTTSTWRWDRDE